MKNNLNYILKLLKYILLKNFSLNELKWLKLEQRRDRYKYIDAYSNRSTITLFLRLKKGS